MYEGDALRRNDFAKNKRASYVVTARESQQLRNSPCEWQSSQISDGQERIRAVS